ncbi:MAG TPA: penicillin acylase family protein [Actinomycetota bacterium]|nr:penicillin acylase family protein [Actinomycetota bacterium]
MADWLDEIRNASAAALPPTDGDLVVGGLEDAVEVRRDRWGVPYVSASSLGDLWFAQGFVTASERLFQIELAIRAANGRLSEWFAELTLAQDRFARVIGLHRIGETEAARWSDASRSMVTRFVEGVHAWVATMPAPPVEYALLGVEPDLPREPGPWAACLAYAAWGLSGNWDHELLRVHLAEELGADAVATLLPPMPVGSPSTIAGGLAGRILDGMPRARGPGSNNWVVAGSRTASGSPLLANDPHLLVQQPGSWFELHLRAPGYEVRGVAFPFLPGILVGVTPHHAWGITNVTGDVQDLYEERLNDAGTAAEHAGAWEPLVVVREEIAVRGAEPVAFDVRSSRHGPLLEVATIGVAPVGFAPLERAYALRWTATDGLLEPTSLVDIASAPDFPTFRNALGALSCPGQNVVYADVDGVIGYQLTGRYPIRASGDGTAPVPGWTAQHEWEGWIAFDELPWSRDPERGYLVTANHRVHEDAYPHVIGHDMHASYRAERIAEILDRDEPATAEASARLQVDTVSLAARRLLPSLTALEGRDDDERWAVGELSGWDGDLSAGSRAASLYNAWIATIGFALFPGRDATADRYLAWRESFVCAALPAVLDAATAPTWTGGVALDELLLDALRDAIRSLTDRLGEDRDAWRWGALHRVRFAHVLARMPGMDAVFVAGEHELGGDEQTVLQAGFDARHGFEPVVIPSYRVVVDLADVDATRAVVPTGGSGHPSSPHWNDQADLWIAGKLREAPVTRAAVEAATTSVLTLLPE